MAEVGTPLKVQNNKVLHTQKDTTVKIYSPEKYPQEYL